MESVNVAKAAGLLNLVTMSAAATAPMAAGLIAHENRFTIILYISSAMSVLGAVIVHTFGSFMKTSSVELLPASLEGTKFE